MRTPPLVAAARFCLRAQNACLLTLHIAKGRAGSVKTYFGGLRQGGIPDHMSLLERFLIDSTSRPQ